MCDGSTSKPKSSQIFKSIVIGCDHGAYDMKEIVKQYIKETFPSIEVVDVGTFNGKDSVDYPDYAKAGAEKVLSGACEAGILLCGTGIGISIAANKFDGIRCGLCHDAYTAEMTRKHNNANILAMGGRTTGIEVAKQITKIFLTTEYSSEDKHQKRLDKIETIEQNQK